MLFIYTFLWGEWHKVQILMTTTEMIHTQPAAAEFKYAQNTLNH